MEQSCQKQQKNQNSQSRRKRDCMRGRIQQHRGNCSNVFIDAGLSFHVMMGIAIIVLSLASAAIPAAAFAPGGKRSGSISRITEVRALEESTTPMVTSSSATDTTTKTNNNGKTKKKAPSADEARAKITAQLQRYQARSAGAASSFIPDKYNPVPFLTNRHLQTIAGVFLRMEPDCAYVPTGAGVTEIARIGRAVSAVRSLNAETNGNLEAECAFWEQRERIRTADGDYFHADYKYYSECSGSSDSSSRGTVILLHGLESSSNSSLSVDLATSYVQRGFDVACLNFRGCCGSSDASAGAYHLGFTDDLRLFLEELTVRRGNKEEDDDRRSPLSLPLYLSGFSLGANVVLKLLGELGEAAVDRYNIAGAAVTGAPFNNELNNKQVEAPGFNKLVYSNNFLRSMKKRLKQNVEEKCVIDPASLDDGGGFDYERCMLAKSIAEFETEYIAAVYGYEDNIDYYQKTSCLYFLDGIAVPTLIINSADDPFFDPDCFPKEKSCEFGGPAPIKFVRTDHGGHLGYMFHQPLVDSNSLEPKMILRSQDDNGVELMKRKTSWMPSEMARFIDHVHVHPTKLAGT